ncbi:MAG: cell division protein ZapA [Christensenellales bacterium]
METQKVTVRVAGRNYSLSSSDKPEHVRRLVSFANRKLAEASAANPTLDRETAAISAAISLSDELLKAQDDNTRLRRELGELRGKTSGD